MGHFHFVILILLAIQSIDAATNERVYKLTDLHSRSYERTLQKRSDPAIFNASTYPSSNQSSISPFSINVQCTMQGSICAKIQLALQRTLLRLAKVIYLPTTVNIQCTVTSACTGANCYLNKNPSKMTVLASAAPSRMVQLSDNSALIGQLDANYLYPSALAKQYRPDDLDFNSQSDIDMTINGDVNWWFWKGETEDQEEEVAGTLGAGKTYDLEQIALHEFCHGLGFVSGWYNWLTEFPDSLLPGYIDDFGNAAGLSPLYIFDKWLLGNTVWMGDYAESIYKTTNAFPVNTTYQDWITLFNSSDANTLSQSLFADIATTPSALLFLFESPAAKTSASSGHGFAMLYTPSIFASGSSISHLDAKTYFATRNYLMRPFGTSGVGVEGYRPMSEYGPIGEAVLQVMRTMGYATALGP